jgi:hypothetical protein
VIPYHGTPLGGKEDQKGRFFTARHALVSFAYKDDLGIVAEKCQSFIFDNGAFTNFKKGHGVIDVVEYGHWVEEYAAHPGFDWCLIPDKIDGTEEENRAMLHEWRAKKYRAKGVPVWHLHESLDYLNFLVENFEIVALGSSGGWKTPGSRKWWDRMRLAMLVACDSKGRPRCKLHGLRMLNPKVFTYLPLASADSTNAAVNSGAKGRWGMYQPPTRAQCADTIASRVETYNSAPVWIGPRIFN